jgi:hypothetical protein
MELNTVNILGRGNGMELAPRENCWGINSIIFERPVDIHFDMHHEGRMKPHQIERRQQTIEHANKYNIPVYGCDVPPGARTYIRYPIEEVLREFPTTYFSNGICYMIALALLKGAKEINFYGVNLCRLRMVSEYTLQKPAVDFWIGVILGRKIPFKINGHMADIGKTYDRLSYGYARTEEEMLKEYGPSIQEAP